jgi:hypothetical protein
MDAAQTQRERNKSSVRVEQLQKQCLCHCPAQRARHGYGQLRRCLFRKSYPDVMVVQSGQDWDGDNDTRSLDRPLQGRVLAQPRARRTEAPELGQYPCRL